MEKTIKRKYKARATIPWQERFWPKVDKFSSVKGCWLWTAAKTADGYGQLRVGDRMAYAHRLSYTLLVGAIPEGLALDHICHDERCVNPRHLRPATTKQNNENASGLQVNNTSGYSGVTWQKANSKWAVRVNHNGAKHYGGLFTDLHEAGVAARELRLKLHTFNSLDRSDSL